MIPQIFYILLFIAALCFNAYKHGQPREGKHNFWISLGAGIIMLFVFYAGGFFDPILP